MDRNQLGSRSLEPPQRVVPTVRILLGSANGSCRQYGSIDRGCRWGSSLASLPGSGVQRFDPATGGGPLFHHNPTRQNSLANDRTSDLIIDRDGLLWIGTDDGLDRHDPRTQRFEAYQADPDLPDALAGDDVWGIGQTSDGDVWIAIDSGGVARFEPGTGRWTQYRHDPNVRSSIASDEPYCLLVDAKDRIWVGTADSGLDRYDPRTDGWIHHRREDGGISEDSVYSLTEGVTGEIWIGLNHGFDRLDPESGEFSHPAIIEGDPDGGMLATTFDLAQASDGLLWIGTFLNGLYTLDLETREFTKFRPEEGERDSIGSYRINALLISRDGTVWAGTNTGLYRHSGSGNHWQVYRRKHGLRNESISALLEGADGTIWIGTSHGLHALDPGRARSRSISQRTDCRARACRGTLSRYSTMGGSRSERLEVSRFSTWRRSEQQKRHGWC